MWYSSIHTMTKPSSTAFRTPGTTCFCPASRHSHIRATGIGALHTPNALPPATSLRSPWSAHVSSACPSIPTHHKPAPTNGFGGSLRVYIHGYPMRMRQKACALPVHFVSIARYRSAVLCCRVGRCWKRRMLRRQRCRRPTPCSHSIGIDIPTPRSPGSHSSGHMCIGDGAPSTYRMPTGRAISSSKQLASNACQGAMITKDTLREVSGATHVLCSV